MRYKQTFSISKAFRNYTCFCFSTDWTSYRSESFIGFTSSDLGIMYNVSIFGSKSISEVMKHNFDGIFAERT